MNTFARRRVLVLLWAPVTGLASAQTLVESALVDLRRYLAAAANMVLGTVSRADSIDPLDVPAAKRPEVIDELKSVSHAIARLGASNEILLMDLSSYVEDVRAGGLTEDRRKAAWSRVVRSVVSVTEVVRSTREAANGSRWLDASLTDADRLTLERTFQGRGLLLAELAALSAPSSPSEIDEVERVNRQYRRLVDSMNSLNVAVAAAARRLATA